MKSQVLVSAFAVIFIGTVAWCRQDAASLSAKTLYYQSEADEEKPAVKSKPKQPHAPAHPVPGKAQVTPPASGATITPVSAKVEHLGLRYNLLLFNRDTHKSVAVDPDHMFGQGDCVQLQFAPNRSGYLYVFDKGSSGKWEVLLPSTLMSDEMNVMQAGQVAAVPRNYCFTVQNPAGTEHLFVVLSRNQEDMYSLDRAIRSNGPSPATNMAAKTDQSSPVTEAANRLDAEIQQMQIGLGSRDLGVEKIAESTQGGEPAQAVYVVNTSSQPSDRLVTEIMIRHN